MSLITKQSPAEPPSSLDSKAWYKGVCEARDQSMTSSSIRPRYGAKRTYSRQILSRHRGHLIGPRHSHRQTQHEVACRQHVILVVRYVIAGDTERPSSWYVPRLLRQSTYRFTVSYSCTSSVLSSTKTFAWTNKSDRRLSAYATRRQNKTYSHGDSAAQEHLRSSRLAMSLEHSVTSIAVPA